MSNFKIPILYIYAVDFGKKTFPNEIYLSIGNNGEGWLVNPIGINGLNGRFEKYMEFHSVTYENLANFGKSPQDWCEILDKKLSKQEVFVSDEIVGKTEFLLDELYSVAKMSSYDFRVKSLQGFLQEKLQDSDLFMKIEELAGKTNAVKEGGAVFFHYLIRLAEFAWKELTKK